MKKIFATVNLLTAFMLNNISINAQAIDEMFRGNPVHNKNYKGFDDKIFNTVAWKFKTGGAVRSTAIAANGSIYFGSSDGYLYSLNKTNGELKWKFNCGSSVTSSPAYSKGLVYILSEQQNLFAIESSTGKLIWKKKIGEDKPYDWGFDYYFSSPVTNGDTLLIASADGKLLSLDKKNGKEFWQFQPKHFIRATPALVNGSIYIGDTNGDMYAVDSKTGSQKWVFNTYGSSLNNDTIGFDRKAIISSAVIEGDAVIFGCRDGFLYCVNRFNGELKWKFDHHVSWVISSPAVINGDVITGTSDGHFVQSVDIKTGQEKWRTFGAAPIWSSPLITGNHVYIGGNEGVLHCIDIANGKKEAHPFCVNAKIFSSPAISDSLMYFGADDGVLYCLKAELINTKQFNRYVYWDAVIGSLFFKNGVGTVIKDFLSRKGYTVVDHNKLLSVVAENKNSGKGNIIVLISSKLPTPFLKTDSVNILHEFLGSGGIMVDLGNNPLVYNTDDSLNFTGFQFKRCASIINIPYPQDDLRSFGGIFTATATAEGKAMGIKDLWTASSPVDKKDVDIVLGVDEKGRASAWVKKIGTGYFVQLWVEQLFPEDYNFVDEVIKSLEKK
jgi:outer membrane protein assembly factor BamB